jgi:hypothetical protein
MRLSIEHTVDGPAPREVSPSDPAAPNLGYLTGDLRDVLRSFFDAVAAVAADNPVATERLQQLVARARAAALTDAEGRELEGLKLQALRQGRAVGAVIALFLKLKPFAALEEIGRKGKLFQPPFGPVLVVDGGAVRDVLERDQDFTVEPYGVEMMKVMSPRHNGGFSTFVLSTDDTALYEPDKRLLAAVCNRDDAEGITEMVHEECVRRVGEAVSAARADASSTIDVVQAVARYVPIVLGDRYLGVPVARERGSFQLTSEMVACYGEPIDGQLETALPPDGGIVPDEQQMYCWIKAAFQHFFNNVQKNPSVQAEGLRSCRLLLAYLLREIDLVRRRLIAGDTVGDTMLTRLVRFQLGQSAPTVARPADLDPRLVTDLRIAENVMGTIVGAVAGQEEATCRVIDAMMRLRDGEYETGGSASHRYGSFDEALELARNVMAGTAMKESRAQLRKYALEALRLQPQGEVLLRKCVRDGARIADARPLAAGTLVFVSHAAAMRDVPQPGAFILDRPREHYLHYGWSRHACLGQFVSPVILVESLAAILGLQDLERPQPRDGESSFPLERRFGRLQLDDNNLYATTFSLQFADAGTTRQFWPLAPAH